METRPCWDAALGKKPTAISLSKSLLSIVLIHSFWNPVLGHDGLKAGTPRQASYGLGHFSFSKCLRQMVGHSP